MAGDSVSWFGGWTEGALETGLNAVAGVAKHLGATFDSDSDSPLSQNPSLYDYTGNNSDPSQQSETSNTLEKV